MSIMRGGIMSGNIMRNGVMHGGIMMSQRHPIAALFARLGVQGFWFDPSDLSTTFQDSAGTIPAVVDAPVGLVMDKSGNGHHLSQATAAARPTLRRDSGGRHYWQFDGIDDKLIGAQVTGFSAALTVAVAVAFDDTSLVDRHMVVSAAQANALAGWYLYLNSGSPQIITRAGNSGSTTAWILSPQLPAMDTAPHVVCTRYVPGAQNSRIDRTYSASATGVAHDEPASGNLQVGAFDTTQYLDGRVYGMVALAANVSDSTRDTLEAYLARRSGVVL